MTTTPPPGSDPRKLASTPIRKSLQEAATYGGPGWQPRLFSHEDEVRLGFIWRACGTRSEVAPLREVVLHWPGPELSLQVPPDRMLMLERIDLARIRDQAVALAELYRSQGVKVHFHTPVRPPPANMIFLRDTFLVTPEGAIVARMAAQQRAGEERFVTEFLAGLGIPILRTICGRATFEGADALWLKPDVLLVGTDRRTNEDGFRSLRDAVAPQGVRLLPVEVPKGAQHLLGIVNFVADDLAVVHGGRASQPLLDLLKDHGYRTLPVPPDEEVMRRGAMNFVTLAPRKLVMPTGCPAARKLYEAEGIEVLEADVTEYLKGAGALGCLTGILLRG